MADCSREIAASLQKRISKLENRVYGDDSDEYPTTKCLDSLIKIHNQLLSATTGRENICQVFKSVADLNKYLDPEYIDKLTLSERGKLEIILEEEDRIRQLLDGLQKMEDLKSVLDSEHIRNTPSHIGKLASLSQIQIEQQEDADAIQEETRNLVSAYNNIINTISKQFIYWDEMLTEIEIAAQPKKIIE